MKLLSMVRWALAPVVLLGAGSVHAQDLAPTGATLRFFEDGPVTTPVGRRAFASRFEVARTRHVGVEVGLTHPAPGAVASYTVTCEYFKPDGSGLGRFDVPFSTIQPDWTSSSNASSWGWTDPGSWQVGTYRAVCSGSGRQLGEGTFEIVSGAPDVPEIGAKVARVRFFPAGAQVPPYGQRQYATSFASDQTSRVGIELQFTHQALGRQVEVPIQCYYHMPDGRVMGPVVLRYQPQPDWTTGVVGDGWGWDQPGQWSRGWYTVVCGHDDRPIAVGRFEIS